MKKESYTKEEKIYILGVDFFSFANDIRQDFLIINTYPYFKLRTATR